jgi:hypothetical protein
MKPKVARLRLYIELKVITIIIGIIIIMIVIIIIIMIIIIIISIIMPSLGERLSEDETNSSTIVAIQRAQDLERELESYVQQNEQMSARIETLESNMLNMQLRSCLSDGANTLRSIKETELKHFKNPVILEVFNLFKLTKILTMKSLENSLLKERQQTKLSLKLASLYKKTKPEFHLALKNITVAMI